MGLFDGVLLCSDWDGTLYVESRLSTRDIEKIKYFQDRGGLFTVCSGRYLPFLEQFFDKIKPNTYVITLNGAIIIHPDTKDVLYEGFLGKEAIQILDKIVLEVGGFSNITVYFENAEHAEKINLTDYTYRRRELLERSIYKIITVSDDTSSVARAKDYLACGEMFGHIAVSSWPYSIEILNENNAKGSAIQRLKQALNAWLTVAVGDYENDISMIKAADIGYAVGNAATSVKAVADRVTICAKNGAIARVISDLEEELQSSATY